MALLLQQRFFTRDELLQAAGYSHCEESHTRELGNYGLQLALFAFRRRRMKKASGPSPTGSAQFVQHNMGSTQSVRDRLGSLCGSLVLSPGLRP